MFQPTRKTMSSLASRQAAFFSTKTMAQVRAKKIALQTVQNPKEFLEQLKLKAVDKNKVASRNLLHLLKRCTSPSDLPVATKGIALYQRKGVDFNSQFCSYFINLCVQAEKPRVAADLIVKPMHRLGAWVSKKSNLTLLNALAKNDDVESMLNVSKTILSKGVAVQTAGSLDVLMEAVTKTGLSEHYAAAMSIAEKSLPPAEIDALKAKYPPSASEAKASD